MDADIVACISIATRWSFTLQPLYTRKLHLPIHVWYVRWTPCRSERNDL